jgi:Na+/alanine symporter
MKTLIISAILALTATFATAAENYLTESHFLKYLGPNSTSASREHHLERLTFRPVAFTGTVQELESPTWLRDFYTVHIQVRNIWAVCLMDTSWTEAILKLRVGDTFTCTGAVRGGARMLGQDYLAIYYYNRPRTMLLSDR